jgi:peptidyl-prolyl cis-trans isomerase C
MNRIIKDPLLHFLLIGALIFVVFAWLDDDDADDVAQRIVISSTDVEQAVQLATMLRGREPDRDEIAQLLEPLIREQVLYREARALGLDRDDETVRLRLVEKMTFLTEDLVEPDLPDDQTLRDFYDADPARFVIPARVTFEQLYFDPRQRGDALAADIDAALARLAAGESVAGDSSPLQARYTDAPYEQVEILFGETFADAMFGEPPGTWYGPFESGFGMHLARLVERTPERQPSFDEARATVLDRYMDERRREANEAEYRRMRDRYEVVIDWPADVS